MNNIPVIKISIVALSMMLNHYKKIILMSVVPIILMLPLLLNIVEIIKQFEQNDIQNFQLSIDILIYSLFFTYGYAALNINLYRLISLGDNSVFQFGISPLSVSLKFIGLSLLISIFNLAPIILSLVILEPIIFILLSHLMLNLVIIATQKQAIKWNLSIINRLNIALLQFIIPLLILYIVALIFGGIFIIFAKVILIYWSAINLALIFNCLYQKSLA